MTQNEKRIAIATACGWKHIEKLLTGWHGWHEIGPSEELPDYFGSLDAIHEAEKVLTEEQWKKYCTPLGGRDINWTGAKKMLHATAEEKAEAFGKALNLW